MLRHSALVEIVCGVMYRSSVSRRHRMDSMPTTIDVVEAGYVYGFVCRALQRHAVLARRVFWLSVGLGALAALLLPKVYRVDSRLLMHFSDRMAAMVNPDRKIPEVKEDPEHKDMLELLYSTDNLGHVVDDFDLPRRFEASRPVWMRAKDAAQQRLFGKISEIDKHQIFITMLTKNFFVRVDNEVLSFGVEWSDPDIALGLSEIAVARFLKMRRDIELAQIYDTVRLLERQASSMRTDIDATVGRMQKIFERKQAQLRAGVAADLGQPMPETVERVLTVYKPTPAQLRANSAAALLRSRLRSKQSGHASARRSYETRLREAAMKVEQLGESLGPKHPDFIEAKKALERISQVPADLHLAQDEESRLLNQLRLVARRGGKGAAHLAIEIKQNAAAQEKNENLANRSAAILKKRLEDDPEVRAVLAEIRRREAAYEQLASRLEMARLEGEAANIAFESRYILTVPPTYPRTVVRPLALIALGAGIGGGLFLALLAALVADVAGRRVQESWQLQRFLKLRVLGEVDDFIQ
jgi:uncharacterized protein involved in exopolysaccharide biosynthesis